MHAAKLPSTIDRFGDIEFTGKDIATPPGSVKFNRIAKGGNNNLYLVSLVAETQRVKQIRSILSGGAKAAITAAGVQVHKPSEKKSLHQPGRLLPTEDGYFCYTHKLGFGLAHAVFITKMPGFMKVVTPRSLWRELNDMRYTTPLLAEWMPYIEKKLRDAVLLEDAYVFNCKCGILSATNGQLDDIVSFGVKTGRIIIPGVWREKQAAERGRTSPPWE